MDTPSQHFFRELDLDEEAGLLELMRESDPLPKQVEEGLLAMHFGDVASLELPFRLIATPFQREVYRGLREIKPGERCSYASLAKRIGQARSTRALASALAQNPLPLLLPCHRVLRADGDLGGFNLGLSVKKKLLSNESDKWGVKHV